MTILSLSSISILITRKYGQIFVYRRIMSRKLFYHTAKTVFVLLILESMTSFILTTIYIRLGVPDSQNTVPKPIPH